MNQGAENSVRLGATNVRGVLQGSFWGVSDQALISLANFLTLFLLARTLAASEFGLFVVVYTGLLIALSLQSALVTQPHNVLGAARERGAYAAYTTSTAAAQLGLIAAVVVVAATAWAVVSASGWPGGAVVLASIPAVVAWQSQELFRRILYTERRFAAALGNDIVSYGGQIAVVAYLAASGRLSATAAFYAMAATSGTAALLGWWQVRRSFAARYVAAAVRENWDFGKWLAGGTLASSVSMHAYFYVVAGVLGAAASGALKAAQILLGPLNLISLFLTTVLPTRFAVTLRDKGQAGLRREVRDTFLVTGPVVAAYCVVLAVFAGPLLELMYGRKYIGYSTVLALFALYYALNYTAQVLAPVLYATAQTQAVFRGNLYALATVPVGCLLLVLLGVEGAVLGMILAAAVVNVTFALAASSGETPAPTMERPRTHTEVDLSVGRLGTGR